MRKLTQSLILAGLAGVSAVGSMAAYADEPAPPYTLTANVSLVTDYYFRGQSQTWHKPALQGGVDFNHSSGWYAGLWGSSISGKFINGGSLEVDYYGGYNGKINDDWGWTAGLYGYYYPGANYNATGVAASQSYNTLEWNAGLSYKWVSVKYSRTLTDWFGTNDRTFALLNGGGTKGSSYLELNANYEFAPSWTVGFHVGKTDVKNSWVGFNGSTNPDFVDYKLGVTKSFKDGWNVGLAYVNASNDGFWSPTPSWSNAADTINPNEGKFIFSAGRTF